MSTVVEKLNQVRSRKVIIETAFDLKSILERLINFNPNFILIDDNVGHHTLVETIDQLSSNRKTKHVPITVLKNSNYHEALASASILDYLLKQNLSAEALFNTVKNALKFKRTQRFLYESYQKRKKLLKLSSRPLNLVS